MSAERLAGEFEPARWVPVAPVVDLLVGRGVGALVDGACVAVFRLTDDAVAAVGGIDPRRGANVMAHGLTGSLEVGGEVVRYVASPLDKARYRLDTGDALVDGAPPLGAWRTRVLDGVVEVAARSGASAVGADAPGGGGRRLVPVD